MRSRFIGPKWVRTRSVAYCRRPAIVGAERTVRSINPVPFANLGVASWVKRVMNLVLLSRRFAAYKQANVALCVVDEGVRDTGGRGEPNTITRAQPMQMSVEPHVWSSFENVDELLFIPLGVRP